MNNTRATCVFIVFNCQDGLTHYSMGQSVSISCICQKDEKLFLAFFKNLFELFVPVKKHISFFFSHLTSFNSSINILLNNLNRRLLTWSTTYNHSYNHTDIIWISQIIFPFKRISRLLSYTTMLLNMNIQTLPVFFGRGVIRTLLYHAYRHRFSYRNISF